MWDASGPRQPCTRWKGKKSPLEAHRVPQIPHVPPILPFKKDHSYKRVGGTGHRSSNAGSCAGTLHRAARWRRKEMKLFSSSSEQCPLCPPPPPSPGPGGFPLEFHVHYVPGTVTLWSLCKWATGVLFFLACTSPSIGEKDSRNMQETPPPRHVWAGSRTTDSGSKGENAPLTLPFWILASALPTWKTNLLPFARHTGAWKGRSGHLETWVHIQGLPFTSYMIGN